MNGFPEAPIEISDGSSGNDEDVTDSEECLDEIKKDLLECLDKIQTAGRVAVSKQHDTFINPGLKIADTLIPLPLAPRDAETIRSVSREAPFGRGDETVVDTSVRKTWELDHTQFTFANPAWQPYVASLLDEAARSLAMSEVRAEPYKLLLYEEGSFFKRHKDSEKVPGMIGTMVICLPSKHDGGSVHLSHAGKSYVFETDKTSDFGLTCLSWFSDVTHEIKPLKSGYRLVLTYNIIHTGRKRISAGLVGKQSERLRSVLVKWESKLPSTEKLIYMLDHKYTQSSLKLSNLKGRDSAVCQCLYEVGLGCGFTIFLAKMTRTQSDERYGYDDEESTELEDVRTCDGLTVCNRESLEDEDILGSGLWNRTPDSVEEGEFTGNESMPSTLRYHDTVVVIVPMSQLPSFIPIPGVRTALSLVSHTLKHRPDDHRLHASMLTILECAFPDSLADGILLSSVIDLATKLRRKTLYQIAVRTALRDSAPRQLVLEKIVRLMKDRLKGTQKHPNWDYWFGDAFSKTNEISLVIQADVLNRLDALIQDDDLKVSFQSWKTSMSEKMVEPKQKLGMEDHDYLVRLLFSQSNDLAWLTNWFAPTLSKKGSNELIYTILRELYYNRRRKTLARATDAYRCILESSTEKLALRNSNFPAPYPYPSIPFSENNLSFEKIIEVISLGLDMGLSKEAIKLLEISCTNICRSSLILKGKKILPRGIVQNFLEDLLAVLQKHKVPPLECVRDMFVALFRDILIGRLPKRPTKPRGWKHKPINCSMNCRDCRELNSFLVNSEEKEREFTMATEQRQHLESQLPKNLFHCRTKTGRAPYGLVVTKLGREFEEDMKDYQDRLTFLNRELRPFKCEYMKSLLGEELYQELVLLKDASGVDGAGTTGTAGTKRKAKEDPDGPSASRPRLVE
ncbi:hypothetical protein F5Y00DRAFT_267723 [Daldinia vernicosa]|uniref:uncharacterized protein n=1 Tax=Daldinia vernicosa TaxID=114800 RepID=UPI002008CBA0|nr:uncharacterized protein F5Y00DRAFT_267723 [Daldinia vernicosa]KAI0851538.1 hypothetical protein F5Y00DRAFT_267723 [Daldinia vernicosa]